VEEILPGLVSGVGAGMLMALSRVVSRLRHEPQRDWIDSSKDRGWRRVVMIVPVPWQHIGLPREGYRWSFRPWSTLRRQPPAAPRVAPSRLRPISAVVRPDAQVSDAVTPHPHHRRRLAHAS
jgi:hypothetical protein